MLTADTEERIQVVVSSAHPVATQQFNPYHLSNINNGYEEGHRISRQFDVPAPNVAKNTDYYFYLRRIYSFWYEYLPSLYKNYQDRTGRASSEQDKLLESGEWPNSRKNEEKLNFWFIPATPKYKHAFFSMLTLVCLLLAILGVCVYILKRNNKSISSATSILWQKFMFRSRLLIDRRIFQVRRTRNDSPSGDIEISREPTTKGEWHVTDGNNNSRSKNNSNFVFTEPFTVDDDDSLESMKIKNWKYHLTNNKF